jgi:hypothetical protein
MYGSEAPTRCCGAAERVHKEVFGGGDSKRRRRAAATATANNNKQTQAGVVHGWRRRGAQAAGSVQKKRAV